MWISGPTEGLENIFLLLQSTSNPDKRVYDCNCENPTNWQVSKTYTYYTTMLQVNKYEVLMYDYVC